MAIIRLQPPGPFNFHNPDNWPHWRKRLQQLRDTFGLSSESKSKKVSGFLYCRQEEVDINWHYTRQWKEYDKILKKVNELF